LFFPQFCDSSHTGSDPQEDLAKFGYRPERKVQNLNPPIFWQPHRTPLAKYGGLIKNHPSKSGDFGTFFPQKSLYYLALDSFLGHPSA
jgi:hypothetical protein